MTAVRTSEAIQHALAEGRPVVALETAVLTHGLPREPMALPLADHVGGTWSTDLAVHVQTMDCMHDAVERAGAVPAPVGVIDGQLTIGLSDDELEHLAHADDVRKASTANLAHILSTGASAGTTVSATLLACTHATPTPIRVFATGGIGGVHRHWTHRPDISADLAQLADAPVCVVCSGAKSLLDLPATLEALETRRVPVVGYQTDCLPRFQAEDIDSLRVPMRLDTPRDVAAMCGAHWNELAQRSAIVLANPCPPELVLTDEDLEDAVRHAELEADRTGATAAERTPFVLTELARLTGGRSLIANVALLVNNASLAAKIALAMADDS